MYKVIPIIHVLSKLGVLFSFMLIVPTFVSYLFLDDAFSAFGQTALITITSSSLVWLLTRKYNRELRSRDGFTLVFMLWIGFAAIAAMPFYLYFPNISYTDAFFEAMSGLTTTGATVMTSLDTLAPSVNFWRHMLNWLGGMGIIVLAVAILPMLGIGGTQLFKAEIPGIDKDSKMAPRISQVAKKLWLFYFICTVLIGLALHWAGMSWFDAVCHAMSAFSLGGFSTHDNSIAYFNSVAVEVVLMIATILGAISFASHFTVLKARSVKPYWRDEECRIMLVTLFASIVAASLYLWHKQYYTSLYDSFRFVSFNFVSIGLANGYANADFAKWPLLTSLWMFFLANVLASSGSVGGGIKNVRAIVLFKFSLREMLLLLHPKAVRTVKVNGRSIPERMALTVLAFIFVYFFTVVLFTFLMMATGLDFVSALTAVIACITNAGPGLGAVGPAGNYAGLNDFQKWLCTGTMLLGRLEIFTVFILFTPAYWKK
ncbi:TrkH family potassium uptake protein [Neisseria weaveri]|uniref:Trk system potassium uptake protein n=1 Tax=Neisseria weaveri TaxID=28091 RepID=A0A3S5C4A6_9NEIS|nr:potassium transporter TrkG [Neisseria weaveri]EGV37530.1 Trk system potassium uptake protein TrkH [Neisseria weaveri LMG 5135]EGV38185.1 Trk system potassium uptake protein TrkH [Neisseria weaveri ATCC 51223]SAY52067.1 bis(5'-nucleosyl)-tetraphosphatase [Neisseria weaveri]VEJ51494.1 bis(5'-nucleosyl)-tetraphosphatase [Neisseria weaveri]